MSATGKPSAGQNIPSLVLTNNDIISPIVCLFDTTGHLMGGLEQGERKEERQSQKKGQKEQEKIKQTCQMNIFVYTGTRPGLEFGPRPASITHKSRHMAYKENQLARVQIPH